MGLFEWWERPEPGEVGRLRVEGERVTHVWVGFTLARFALTVSLFVAAPLAVTFRGEVSDPWSGLGAAVVFLAYLVLGWFVRPEPNTSNLGWFGGLIDHPFKYSDDLNRNLMFLAVALLPGYVLARPVVEVFYWLAGEAEET